MFFTKKDSEKPTAASYKLTQSNKFLGVQFSVLEAEQAGAFIDEATDDQIIFNEEELEKK